MRRRSCSIKANTLRRSLQFGFQLQNDIVEQTSCDWVGRFSCQNSVALHPISALLPTVAVSHGDVPPCSDPQRGHNGVLELRSHCGAAIRTPLHFPEAISAANSANGGTGTVRMGLPALPRQPPPPSFLNCSQRWGCCRSIDRPSPVSKTHSPASAEGRKEISPLPALSAANFIYAACLRGLDISNPKWRPTPRCWGRLQMIRRNEGLDPETTPAHRPALIGTTLETSCS